MIVTVKKWTHSDWYTISFYYHSKRGNCPTEFKMTAAQLFWCFWRWKWKKFSLFDIVALQLIFRNNIWHYWTRFSLPSEDNYYHVEVSHCRSYNKKTLRKLKRMFDGPKVYYWHSCRQSIIIPFSFFCYKRDIQTALVLVSQGLLLAIWIISVDIFASGSFNRVSILNVHWSN